MPRIERFWTNLFGNNIIKRKESPQDDQQKRQNQHQQSKQDSENPKQEIKKQDVESAIADLKKIDQFNQTGMGVELVETKEGIHVKLSHANGHTIKTMSAAEFLRLRDQSQNDQPARGKILDQKF